MKTVFWATMVGLCVAMTPALAADAPGSITFVAQNKVATADGLNLPMLETNKKLWERMLEDGLGELDHSGLFEWYRQVLEKERGSE